MKNILIVIALFFLTPRVYAEQWPIKHPDNAYSATMSYSGSFSNPSWEYKLNLWYQEDFWWLETVPVNTPAGARCGTDFTIVQNAIEYTVSKVTSLKNQVGQFLASPCDDKLSIVYKLTNVPIDYKQPFTFYLYDHWPDKEISFNADVADFVDFVSPGPEPKFTTRLSNISTRGKISGGPDILYGGFIVTGEGVSTVYIKGGAVDDGLDTVLKIVSSDGEVIAVNDNWQDDPRVAEVPEHLKLKKVTDSGLLLDLEPGTYNALVSGKETVGHAIVSVWEIR